MDNYWNAPRDQFGNVGAAQPQHESFLSRIAPTGLSILGGVGGTLLGGPLGGIAGATLGGGIGKGIEDVSQGNGLDLKSELGAAAEGGLGQALGGGVGSILGKVAGNTAGKLASNAVDREAGDLFGRVNPTTFKKLGGDVGMGTRGALEHASSLDIPTNDIDSLVNQSHTAQQALYGTLDSILGGTKVDLNGLREDAIKSLADNSIEYNLGNGPRGSLLATGKGANLVHRLTQEVQNQAFGGEGSLNGISSGEDAIKLLRGLRNLKSSALSRRDPSDTAFYNDMIKNVSNRIYNNPEAKAAVSAYRTTPEDESAILNAVGGNQSLANHVINTLNNAKEGGDINGAVSKLINVRALGQAAQQIRDNTIAEPVKGGTRDILSAAGHLATGNPIEAMKSVIGSGTPKATAAVADKASTLLGKMNDLGIPGAATAGLLTLPNAIDNGNNGEPMQQTSQNSPQQAGSSNYDNLIGAMTALSILDPFQSSGATSLLGGALPNLQRSNAANALLQGFQGQYGSAGGAQGFSGNGILDTILANIPGTPQHAAKQQASTLTQLLGVSPGMAPTFTQSPQTAGNQLSTLAGLSSALGGY